VEDLHLFIDVVFLAYFRSELEPHVISSVFRRRLSIRRHYLLAIRFLAASYYIILRMYNTAPTVKAIKFQLPSLFIVILEEVILLPLILEVLVPANRISLFL
jgi:hypothetical protein